MSSEIESFVRLKYKIPTYKSGSWSATAYPLKVYLKWVARCQADMPLPLPLRQRLPHTYVQYHFKGTMEERVAQWDLYFNKWLVEELCKWEEEQCQD